MATGSMVLGELDRAELLASGGGYAVPLASHTVDGFCIDAYPFPGRAGLPWPDDGLAAADVSSAVARAQGWGRRLCSVEELMAAAAGPSNHRHPYASDARREGACPEDDSNPGLTGAVSSCVSALGVHDLGVRSTWAVLDGETAAALGRFGGPRPPPWEQETGGPASQPARWVVWGGTARTDTFHPDTNFAVHLHVPPHGPYQDDGLRLCAAAGSTLSEAQALRRDRDLVSYQEHTSIRGWLEQDGAANPKPRPR